MHKDSASYRSCCGHRSIREMSMFTFVIVTVACFLRVEGGGFVSFRMTEYKNPSHKRESGKCCEMGIFTNSYCSNRCDNYFKICFKALTSSSRCRTLTSRVFYDDDIILFGDTLGNGVPNPMVAHFVEPYQGTVEVNVEVWDKDRWNSDDIIVRLRDTVSLSAGRKERTQYTARSLSGRRSTLKYKVKVYCEENYYGKDCNTFCKVTHSSNMHYRCDPATGAKVCFRDWAGKNCDKDLNKCRHRPCQNSAKCVNTGSDAYKCQCKFGFTGKHCETELDPCLNYLNLGRQSNPPPNATHNETIHSKVTIDKAWYRIRGFVKGRLASKCNRLESCTAKFPAYGREELPEVKDNISEREACVSSPLDCCHMTMSIKVKACIVGKEKYVVYQLRLPPFKEIDYCYE